MAVTMLDAPLGPWRPPFEVLAPVDEAAARLVGLEVDAEQLAGKRFLSQQRTEADRRSVVAHLAEESAGSARDVARLITP